MGWTLVHVYRGPVTPGDSDGYAEALDPPTWWAQIEPLDPASTDQTRLQGYRVSGRFHPQLNADAFLRVTDTDPFTHATRTRDLFVKGVQNIGGHDANLLLYCEEAIR